MSPDNDRLPGWIGATRARHHTASSCADIRRSTYAFETYADTSYTGPTDPVAINRRTDSASYAGSNARPDSDSIAADT